MNIEVTCKTLVLTLDEQGRAISLRHRASGYEFLSAQSAAVGLWELGLIRPIRYDDPLPPIVIPKVEYAGHEWWANRNEYQADLTLDSNDATTPLIAANGDDLSLTWNVPIPEGVATVIIRITGGKQNEQIEFRTSVSLPGNWALKRVTFPRLRGFGDTAAPQSDALLYPENWGVLRHNPLADKTNYTGQYPSAANWCQMVGWLHGKAGLYLGVRDPDTQHSGIDAQYVEGAAPAPVEMERWHIRDAPAPAAVPAGNPAIQLRCHHWPNLVSTWECPYPVVLQGFTGNWYEAARIHRDWATQQRWCRRGKLVDRSDASQTLANLDLWFLRYGFHPGSFEPKPAGEFQQAIHTLHNFFQMPFGVHWYHWHNFSWHRNFPSHAPAVEGFAEVARELQSRGIVIMPYCQGRLLYRDRPGFETERTHASVEANGQPYLEMYTPQDHWPLALCPGDPWSQSQWQEAARMLWQQYGVDGVYFDQITAMMPSLCYHAGHGHKLGGGTQYWQGYDRALDSMAPLIAENPRRFLSSELMADAYLDRIDLYLTFVPPLEDYVPLFTAIYGGYTTVMGRATPEAIMEDLQLFAMCQGEQLLFGGQLGWFNEVILNHPAAARYLKELAQLRSQVRPTLHYGTLELPMEGPITGQRVSISLPPAFCAKPRPVPIERDAIVNTVWRGPDGTLLLLFLNESRAEATIQFSPRSDWPRGPWQLLRLGQTEREVFQMTEAVSVSIPAFGVVALTVQNDSGRVTEGNA